MPLYGELNLAEDSIVFKISEVDSIHTLNYIYPDGLELSDTVTYILKADKDFHPKYISSRKEAKPQDFDYVGHQEYKINDKVYPIFKYASNALTTDGCITHFWTPEIGIILTRSASWGDFGKLQTNNDSINRQINLLAELLFQDVSFYKGCTEEMELIPRDDAEEFYKEKSKGLQIEY
ncbi:hypothetical protein [Cesiribacter andamanensis]|nr:hypothetical protein [Cesiribacter andamanensis]